MNKKQFLMKHYQRCGYVPAEDEILLKKQVVICPTCGEKFYLNNKSDVTNN